MPMNLRINHATVGPFRGGVVVHPDVFEGGKAEVDRLISLGAVSWTVDEITEDVPLARTAVAEMPDDELTKENERLRKALEKAKADGDERHAAAVKSAVEAEVAKAVAAAKAEADAKLAEMRAALEKANAAVANAAVANGDGAKDVTPPKKK